MEKGRTGGHADRCISLSYSCIIIVRNTVISILWSGNSCNNNYHFPIPEVSSFVYLLTSPQLCFYANPTVFQGSQFRSKLRLVSREFSLKIIGLARLVKLARSLFVMAICSDLRGGSSSLACFFKVAQTNKSVSESV